MAYGFDYDCDYDGRFSLWRFVIIEDIRGLIDFQTDGWVVFWPD